MLGREKKGEGCALNEEEEEKKTGHGAHRCPALGHSDLGSWVTARRRGYPALLPSISQPPPERVRRPPTSLAGFSHPSLSHQQQDVPKHSRQGMSIKGRFYIQSKRAAGDAGVMGTGCQQEMKSRDVAEAGGRRRAEQAGTGGPRLPKAAGGAWVVPGCGPSLPRSDPGDPFQEIPAHLRGKSPSVCFKEILLFTDDFSPALHLLSLMVSVSVFGRKGRLSRKAMW